GSPLGELHRCVEERIRVRVHIRTFKGLRGVCSGFVVAFDKFWNMDPAAQQETYGKVHTRHINQLFIRGENVILVNPQPL
ncbi:U7 snRNA-associated Sm-like protein LSm11, partial [Goodea atripinnis]